MSDEKVLKMLKEALSLELWAITLYEDNIRRIGNKKIRQAYAELVEKGEIRHAETLRRAIHKITLNMPVKNKLSKERVKEVLATSLKEEIGQQRLYKKCIDKISDKQLKKELKHIFDDEVKHERKIRGLINSLEK